MTMTNHPHDGSHASARNRHVPTTKLTRKKSKFFFFFLLFSSEATVRARADELQLKQTRKQAHKNATTQKIANAHSSSYLFWLCCCCTKRKKKKKKAESGTRDQFFFSFAEKPPTESEFNKTQNIAQTFMKCPMSNRESGDHLSLTGFGGASVSGVRVASGTTTSPMPIVLPTSFCQS
jgi:hypothetical protein